MAREVNRRQSPQPSHRRNQPSRQSKLPRITRDAVLFIAGLTGVFYETVFVKSDRPALLFMFGAMIGLPAFLRTDEARKWVAGGQDKDKPDDEDDDQ